MLTLAGSVRVFLCTQATDMRRLSMSVLRMGEEQMGQDPFSGHLFVFFNRRAGRAKILYWAHSGPAIWYKRLEEGTFRVDRTGWGSVEMGYWTLRCFWRGSRGVRSSGVGRRCVRGHGRKRSCRRPRARLWKKSISLRAHAACSGGKSAGSVERPSGGLRGCLLPGRGLGRSGPSNGQQRP